MTNNIPFKPHNVDWNQEKVNRFWGYFVTNPSLLNLSFASEVGRDIVNRTILYIKRDGNNLDYGCGGGALMGYLFKEGIPCAGIDSSEESIKITKERFSNNPLFKGVKISTGIPHVEIHDNTYDFVYFVETIEHILPKDLDNQLKELNRIVKKGGYIFVSTPNNENLGKYTVMCPDCGAKFHRVQHQTSFTVDSLVEFMGKAGFEKVLCEGMFLKNPSFVNTIKRFLRKYYYTNEKDLRPHLIYIGKKI